MMHGDQRSGWRTPVCLFMAFGLAAITPRPLFAQFGACCLGDGGCFETNSDGCDTVGGEFLGAGTSCAGAVCAGACCLADDTCTEGSADDCVAGEFRGAGSTCATHCPAPLGTGFTWQGQLRQNGAPVTETCAFESGLWDSQFGGVPVGTQTLSGVTVTDGVFELELDFGAEAFDGQRRWLEIAVQCGDDPGPTVLSPRQEITATPYALQTRGIVADDESTVIFIDGTPGLRLLPAFHLGDLRPNVVAGHATNQIGAGTTSATVSGGGASSGPNRALGNISTVGGGASNTAGGDNSTVGGGSTNMASGGASTVAGGALNTASGFRSNIGGGGSNTAQGSDSTIGGGANNLADAQDATVGGGLNNTASASRSTVGGGERNTASRFASTVAGGINNTASGDQAFVGGGGSGGGGNEASGIVSAIAGGDQNVASGSHSVVVGGLANTAGSSSSTVGGGQGNTAGSAQAVVGGGLNNTASGLRSVVPGGELNQAGGNYSLAAGRRAKVRDAAQAGNSTGDQGTFIWAGATNADITSTGSNQFLVRAAGGMWFGTNSGPSIPTGRFLNTSTGGFLSTGGTWTNNSDRAAKENLQPLSGRDILKRVVDLPISEWNYKSEDQAVKHIGPTAQDFYAAFGVGGSDKAIATIDADGVALAAIQGLYELVREKEARIARQDAEIAALRGEKEREVTELRERLARLESLLTDKPKGERR